MQNDLEPDMLPWLKNNTDADIEARQGTTFQYIGINFTHPILAQESAPSAGLRDRPREHHSPSA